MEEKRDDGMNHTAIKEELEKLHGEAIALVNSIEKLIEKVIE